MTAVLRVVAALLLAALSSTVAGWLLLVCADFSGFEDCLWPRTGWAMFAAVSALALTLPPALHAWPDLSRQPRELIRESLRASLLSFALFAILFLAGSRFFFEWMKVPHPMTGIIASNLSLTLACPLAFLSYTVSRKLLPRPAPDEPEPRTMRLFGWLALGFLTLAAIQPWMTGGASLLFSSRLSLICAAWLVLSLRMVLLDHGEAGFVPMWGAFCLICSFRIGSAIPYARAVDIAVGIVLLTIAAWSCFCLLHKESREWLR